jgi:Cu(I)/Ag(I) efflux system membrane fusion protein
MRRTLLLASALTLSGLVAAGSVLVADGARAQSEHAGHGAAAPQAAPPPTTPAPHAPPTQKRILYYRNGMGLPDTSPVPKKDQMGMDYIPVYEGEDTASGAVTISAEKIQKLGVRTEVVGRRVMSRVVRAVGAVAVDERAQYVVAPRFEAWIETLRVDTTGAAVRRGDVLMEVYGPDLVLAQEEYLSVRGVGGMLADAALRRLRNLGIDEIEIERLKKTGKASHTLPLRASADGVVLEKTAVRGLRFMPGDTLYRIADLSSVWVIAEVFEQDLGLIRIGQSADIGINSLPGRTFTGKVGFIYPTLAAESRTAKIRIELPNAEGVLRPNLYATVRLDTGGETGSGLAVPDSALLDTGTRQVVLVEIADGRYEPREVKTGQRGDGWVRIEDGLGEGERIVVRANFLIDSESNLRSALGAFAPPAAKTQ